ncbi:MAG: hypothetical protein WDZ48_00270 [Pirellulales bacterium]
MLEAVLGAGSGAGQQPPADAPLAPPPGASARPSPRELLELFSIDDALFGSFADDRPLDPSEREKLVLLLHRLRQIPLGTMEDFSLPGRAMRSIRANPDEYRGEVFSVPGFVQYVAREELPPEAREKFQLDAWYRCQIVTFLGTNVTLYAASIPRAWKLDVPLEERCDALAMFVKVLAPAAAGQDEADIRQDDDAGSKQTSFLFVAPRVAWHPNTMLGELRMDVGLFDDVRDRGGLDERECFYQLLAAATRAGDGRIERAARAQLTDRQDLLERVARNRHQGEKARAAAERALKRAAKNADDVVPLFNEPASQRGRLLVLSGEALRAIEVRVNDPDIVKRFGIDHYFEVEIVTEDSQNNPIACCLVALPPDMPLGEAIHENVSVSGFFLKTWAFDAQKTSDLAGPGDSKRQQLAPLLIGKTLRVIKPPAAAPQSPTLAIGIVLAILLGAALMWQLRRAERRALANTDRGADSLPERIAIDESPDAAGDTA